MSVIRRHIRAWFSAFLLLAALPAAAQAAPPLSLYGNLPGFEMAALSHSGTRFALIGVAAGKRRLMVFDQQQKLLNSIDLNDAKVWSIDWAGDDLLLVRQSMTVRLGVGFTTSKAELETMHVIPLNGDKPWTVFQDKDLIQGGIQGYYGLVQKNGRWFGYFSGITLEKPAKTEAYLDRTAPILYEVDLQNQKIRKIADRAERAEYRKWLVGPDGNVAAIFRFNESSGKWTIRNSEGKEAASGVTPSGRVSMRGLGRTPGTIIYSVQEEEDGVTRWYEAPLAGGDATEFLPDIDVGGYFIDPVTHGMIGYVVEGDVPAYTFFDAYHNKVAAATMKAFPGMIVRLKDWNAAFNRLIVQTEGPGDPMTWWMVDIKTGQASILGSSYPMASEDVAPVKMIAYKASDGLDIQAILTLPPGRPAKNLPVVIMPHGGPTARDYPGFDWWAQAVASRGYAVLQPNFRGSSGYGDAFRDAGDGEWGRKMQTDLSDGLAQLVKDGIADPRRACIMGASYGGYAALAGVTLQQGLYRCAVSVAGIGDLTRMFGTEMQESGGSSLLRRHLKKMIGRGRDLKEASPIRFADRADAPVLLIHGKDDVVVRYDQSNDMADALRKAGKPVEMVTLDGADHWLTTSETRQQMLNASVAFLLKHNPPDPR